MTPWEKEALEQQGLEDPNMLLGAQETTATTMKIYSMELLPVISVIDTGCLSRLCL